MKDSQEKFSHITISLHWLIAITFISLLAVGIYMEESKAYALYPIHKSTGILIFAFILVRVVWRIINGWPKPASDYKKWETRLAKIVHWVLIIGTVLMPLSGMMMSALGGHGLDLFGLQLMAPNPDPNDPSKMLPINGTVAGAAHSAHGIIGNIMIAAILLHIAGALKHHIIDKDGTLKRMLGKRV